MTILSRQNYRSKRQPELGEVVAKGKVTHRNTTYKTMMHGLRLKLDREPTDSEIYAFLCEVNK